jgi:multiple sugar transport system substrate-binding protein
MGGKACFSWMSRLLVGITLLAVLAGCGGLGLSTPEPVELTFSYLENAADYQPLVEAFQTQHPYITIKLTEISSPGGGGGSPTWTTEGDVVRMPSIAVSEDMAEAFLPLDTLISTDQKFPQDGFFSGSLDALKYDGKLIGLPAGLNPFVVYYLPKKFAAAGVQPPAAGWTIEDFVSVATAVHNPDETLIGTDRYAYGYCTHPVLSDSALFSYIFGGRLFDSLVQITQPTLNDPGNVAALAWYGSLKTELELVPPSRNVREVGALLYRNSCGLWIDWLDKSTFGPGGAVEAEPLPLPHGVTEFNIATQDGYFISRASEHADEAFLWASFLMQQQSASGRLIPPMKQALNTPEYAARAAQSVVNVARSLPEQTVILGIEMARNQRFGNVLEYFAAASQKVIEGEASAQTALDEAQLQAEQSFR